MTQVILASTSPRRKELLKQAQILFEVRAPDIDETPKKNEKPQALVKRLATEKAQHVLTMVGNEYPDCLVIAADTIVVSPDGSKILGKPESPKHAIQILKSLSAKTHTVYTGYALLRKKVLRKKSASVTRWQRVVRTRVSFRKLSPNEIQEYVHSGEPMDKAGAYGAQGVGGGFIDSIHGSFTNVVGLPISQVIEDLRNKMKSPKLRKPDYFQSQLCARNDGRRVKNKQKSRTK